MAVLFSRATRGRHALHLGWVVAAWLGLGTLSVSACSESTPKDPFIVHDAGLAGMGGAEQDAAADSAAGAPPVLDPELGRPCLDDGQCDDDIDCTLDSCDLEFERCRHRADHDSCADDVYCDGVEVCDPQVGCREGEPVSCSDDRTCTIDRCIEETRSCEYQVRDADGDGDGVWNCGDGGDCNDQNPLVSSLREEVCSNGIDDDCDQRVDESDCVAPANDRCETALAVTETGSYALSFVAAQGDYGISCVDAEGLLDVVLTVEVPEGAAKDVDILVESDELIPALAFQRECGEVASEELCAEPVEASGRALARLRARDLQPGSHSFIVFADREGDALARVRIEDPLPEAGNESCGTATRLDPGQSLVVLPYAAVEDHSTGCDSAVGDLVFEFSLDEAQDVHLYSGSLDGFGEAVLSLRDAACAPASSELTCRGEGSGGHLFARNLAPGDYTVLVSATGPSALSLLLELEAPSEPPAADACETAPELPLGQSATLAMGQHTDKIAAGCLVGAVDAAQALSLEVPSDLLLLQSFSAVDTTALGLASDSCSASSLVACAAAQDSPLRVYVPGQPAGNYFALVESAAGNNVRLAVLTRPASSATLVPFSDTCEAAFEIPESGGHFFGNTATAGANYPGSCDYANALPPAAPDQLLRMTLSERRRVVLDMTGSGYDTMLIVRAASSDDCLGDEIERACSPDFGFEASYLDLVLEPGDYLIQIDGYDSAAGPWELQVFSAPV